MYSRLCMCQIVFVLHWSTLQTARISTLSFRRDAEIARGPLGGRGKLGDGRGETADARGGKVQIFHVRGSCASNPNPSPRYNALLALVRSSLEQALAAARHAGGSPDDKAPVKDVEPLP